MMQLETLASDTLSRPVIYRQTEGAEGDLAVWLNHVFNQSKILIQIRRILV
jgi:hypothetical protein